ncbi:RCC1/BLIP-II [Auriscalpium vulgare]|uniref:RCC1/BLIP-II n=1 Tax=Auriscalpium vulgare TaxID=40419 RepID=A0ACB8S1G5_9AGAM|nr:RCC1/BLIP-II [Auriscalpium vulgare]
MLSRSTNAAIARSLRRQYSQATRAPSRRRATAAVAAVSTALVAAHLLTPAVIYNDAPPASSATGDVLVDKVQEADDRLRLLVWGSNRSHVLSPGERASEQFRVPVDVAFLEGVALRDLAMHAAHAACVDARGDVYQWGDSFHASSSSAATAAGAGGAKPTLTLQGKNITRLQVTESRVFALSTSGKIYVTSARSAQQNLSPGAPTPSSDSWWGTGWLWGEDVGVDFLELAPSQKLAWGERFVSIAAGRDHLLALTSSGRTFAHPINKNANTHGQLGLRKFDVPDPSSSTQNTRLHVELTPLAVVDPYAKSSRLARLPSSSASGAAALLPVSENLQGVDDASLRFSDRLFEVPSLKEVKVDQIAAGGRSSFVKTDTGRVLGWGANDFGQIGLGGNVVLDTITVPTEVVLSRSTARGSLSKCIDINAAGDLSFFTVERRDGSAIPTVDLLSCGNGQYGGLGNALFTSGQGVPVRTKSVSGLLEYSETSNSLQPITPHALSVSPDGHVLLTLDTLARAGPGGGGRDVLAWGTNYEYQLGSGRRTNVAVPATLVRPDGQRLMLMRVRAPVVRDPQGRVWRRGVEVEQVAVAGFGNSVVYWRICA